MLSIDFEKLILRDSNIFGELLRNWAFVGEGLGCYANFELRDGFVEIDPNSPQGKALISGLQYVEDEEEDYSPDVYLYHHPDYDVYVAWYWDGDGTLLIGYKENWALNTDCKKSDEWEWTAVDIGDKRKLGVSIDGVVYANEGNLKHKEFLDAFIEFVESRGWYFGGLTKQVDEEGNCYQCSNKE